MKQKVIPAAATAALVLAASQASAQLLYEPFDYPPGVTPPPTNTHLDTQVNPGQGQAWSRMGSSTVATDLMDLASSTNTSGQVFDYTAAPLAGLPSSYGNTLAYHGSTNG